MTRRLMEQRAETLCLWYREQPDHATNLRDGDIAVRLAGIAPTEGWTDRLGRPCKQLVRSVRQWVDRQSDGVFADQCFGTRASRDGGWSHLRSGAEELVETSIGATAQAVSTESRMRNEMETRARESMKWQTQSEAFFKLGDYRRSMVCDHAANDVEQTGFLSPRTRADLKLLGLL